MKKLDFCSGWFFSSAKEPDNELPVTLPHDAMIHEQRDPACVGGHSTGYYPGGVYRYRKDFLPEPGWKEQSVILEFEGIYQNSTVSLNGETLLFHPNGYTNFYVDLTDRLCFDTENRLEVSVDTALPGSRWYPGSGIYRPVWLHLGNRAHILPGSVSVQTLDVSPAVLRIRAEVSGGDAVRIRLTDPSGTVVADETYAREADRRDDENAYTREADRRDDENTYAWTLEASVSVPDAALWSSETPRLYICRVSLFDHGVPADETSLSCGICKLTWSTRGLYVNGTNTKLRGACIHHDNGILGACDFPDASFRKVELLKEAGFNAIRSAHNPVSASMLEACDRLGMYVMDEFTDMWYTQKSKGDYSGFFSSCHEQDLASMIRRDRSHPCVILYSIGNEVTETCELPGIELAQNMAALIRRMDDTRPVTCGINMTLNVMHFAGMDVFHTSEKPSDVPPKTPRGYAHMDELQALQSATAGSASVGNASADVSSSEYFNRMMRHTGDRMRRVAASKIAGAVSEEAYAALDIAGYNYGDGRYYLDREEYPDRISVGSETLPQDIAGNWKAVTELPYLIGDFLWTGWDYLGEARIGSFCYESSGCKDNEYPALLSGSGVIDITGMPRPETALNRIAYGLENGPVLSVEPVIHAKEDVKYSAWRRFDSVRSWSWSGFERYPARLVIYADAARVDVLLDGVCIGSAVPKDFTALLETTYRPGTLTAIAYDANGQEIGRDSLTSASKKDVLTVIPSVRSLRANGQDLCFLDIRLTDQAGIVKSSSDRAFTVHVSGEAALAAIGSADPFSTIPYTGDSHRTYYGRGQAVLRSGFVPGTAHATVEMEGCEPLSLEIPILF